MMMAMMTMLMMMMDFLSPRGFGEFFVCWFVCLFVCLFLVVVACVTLFVVGHSQLAAILRKACRR